MTPDPRWLEILKASGWQLSALAVASGVFIALMDRGYVPGLPSWARPVAFFATLAFASLSVASVCAAASRARPAIWASISDWRARQKWSRALRSLPEQGRILLSVIEEDALDRFPYEPRLPAIQQLRERDIIRVNAMAGDGASWAQFFLTAKYLVFRENYPQIVRRYVKYTHDERTKLVRVVMHGTRRLAAGRL